MQVLVIYAEVLDLEYGIKFFDASICDIIDYTRSSKYLPTTALVSYVWYLRSDKLCINDSSLLPLI